MRSIDFKILKNRVSALSPRSQAALLRAAIGTLVVPLALALVLSTNAAHAATTDASSGDIINGTIPERVLDTIRDTVQDLVPIKDRNMEASRKASTKRPRNIRDQAIVNGWPLYRTDRGQQAFNHAMATLKATTGPAPTRAAFKGCANLECNISLPKIGKDGWLRAGRIWISPNQYVLIVHSPRRSRKKKVRRNSSRRMKYFIFHEFQNSTHNTDPYDTISAHKFSVYVPFYMGKQMRDVSSNRFVVVVQVAPYDVRSIHASNMGSAGPGIEVAKNTKGKLEPLQGVAGILVATMVKKAAPRLKVVNHRGAEGRPMLKAYKRRLAKLKKHPGAANITLPFVPAIAARVASIKGARLGDLIKRPGLQRSKTLMASAGNTASPPTPMQRNKPIVKPAKKRQIAAVKTARTPPAAASASAALTMSPLAKYLKANLGVMKQVPHFAKFIPDTVAAILEDGHEPGVVYLLDDRQNVLGKIHAETQNGEPMKDGYVYEPIAGAVKRVNNRETRFSLEIQNKNFDQIASLVAAQSFDQEPKLIGPPTRVTGPKSPPEPMLLQPPKLANSSFNRVGG